MLTHTLEHERLLMRTGIRYPVLMYTKDGRQGIDALWKQTLAELELSVEDITD